MKGQSSDTFQAMNARSINTASAFALIDLLASQKRLERAQYVQLLQSWESIDSEALFALARTTRERIYGKDVYMRGLIEFTNYCQNDCYYCGIRRGNEKANRYRLTEEEILDCCHTGYRLGFRTFVLQGGEDPYFTDERLEAILQSIRRTYRDCAITLSVGERSRESYQRLFRAGAQRYLLRHETANEIHYRHLHPPALSLANRKRCLWDLKDMGYQVGCGFMVGTPGQSIECLADDLCLIQELKPHMVGIGPFIPHGDTPFAAKPQGSLALTLVLLAVVRLLLPNVLLPATTALETIHPEGRKRGLLAGANVVMPNLSPAYAKNKYLLYDGKPCTGDQVDQSLSNMQQPIEKIGYRLVVSRGDHAGILPEQIGRIPETGFGSPDSCSKKGDEYDKRCSKDQI